MIAYIRCMCGKNRSLANDLKSKGYEVRVTSKKTEWRREAESYKARLPFTVVDGKVTEL